MRRVICGFPGVGKTHLAERAGFHDSDSSQFSQSPDGRNPNFPANYVEHIRGLDGVVLCSTHWDVRVALGAAGIDYEIVVPLPSLRDEYLDRYEERGDPPQFIGLLRANWAEWVDAAINDLGARSVHCLRTGEFLDALFPLDAQDGT